MRAAQLVAPRQWEIIETDKPEPVGDQMLVRMERVAVCGSDKPPFCGPPQAVSAAARSYWARRYGAWSKSARRGAIGEGERVLLWGFDRGLFQEYVLAKDDGGCIRLPGDLPEEKVLMSQLFGHGDPQLLQAGQYH